MPDKSEAQIQKEIMDKYERLHWIDVWRQNTGASNKGNRYVRYGIPGQADISGLITYGVDAGKRVEIEVKTRTGRQSEKQKEWEVRMRRGKAIYILAKSVEDVDEALKEYAKY